MSQHQFIPLPDDDQPSWRRLNSEHASAIKRWTREVLSLAEDVVITVSEVACADAGCPLVETVIVVFEERSTRRWKLTRPRVAVTRAMLSLTITHCGGRKKYGQVMPCHPSPFLKELPPELVETDAEKSKKPVEVSTGKSLFAAMREATQ